MAREYAQLRLDMWADDDWRALTAPAQHLYMLLLSDAKLTYCGVTTWHPARLAQRSRESTGSSVVLAAAELADAHFLIIDEETEEVLIRSYLRHDPLLKNPRLAVTMAREFAAIASNKLRQALVWELRRMKKASPDLGAWDKPEVANVLRQNACNPRDMLTDLPIGAATYLDLGIGLGVALPSDMGKSLQRV